MAMTSDYAIIVNAGRFACFRRQQAGWISETLKGEDFLPCATSAQLTQACAELTGRLAYHPAAQLFILYQQDLLPGLADVIHAFADQPVTLLPLQPWLERARSRDPGTPDSALYARYLLPSVSELFTQGPHRDAASDDLTQLAQQFAQEQKENLALQAELEACQQRHNAQADAWKQERAQYEASMSHVGELDQAAIAQFMPLFFAHFWQKVSPTDMAMLLGSLTVPEVRSPWPEPDRSALAIKRRDFHQLRHRHQQQIKAMARKFIDVGYLSVRPDAEPLLD